MSDYPTSLPAFQRRFSTEDDCRQYLIDTRWPDGFVCPKCGAEQKAYISTLSTRLHLHPWCLHTERATDGTGTFLVNGVYGAALKITDWHSRTGGSDMWSRRLVMEEIERLKMRIKRDHNIW